MSGRTPVTIESVAAHPNARRVQWYRRDTEDPYFSMECPFHEDESPSLLVFKNGYSCQAQSCRSYGNLSKLFKKLDSWFSVRHEVAPEQRVFWSEICDGGVPTEEFLEKAHEATRLPDVREWYRRRGLESMIEPCYLGWWRGWFVTPVYDENRHPLRVVLRAGPSLESTHRYEVSPGDPVLYVPDWGLLHTKPKYILFPFGIYDAITLAMLRYPAVTGAGPDRLPVELFKEFRRKIYVVPDMEPLEEKRLAQEYVQSFGWRGGLLLLKYPKGVKDPNDFLIHKPRDLDIQLGSCCYE